MGSRDAMELLILSAVWGASFLFMRIAAPELGPIPLIALRVGIAAALLLPLLALRGGLAELRRRPWPLLVVGAINSALPFCLLAYATLSVTAGLASILNATSPLWGGLVAHVWLRDRLTRSRALGLLVGFAGVAFLFWGRASFRPGGAGLAVLAALAATLSYGVAASTTRRHLRRVDPLAVAAGSQLGAALLLLPLAVLTWPAGPVTPRAWEAVAGLAVACTAFAYLIYFRLLAVAGPTKAMTVTILTPFFSLLWGVLFLREPVNSGMLVGLGVILASVWLVWGARR